MKARRRTLYRAENRANLMAAALFIYLFSLGLTFSLARCSRATKAKGTDRLLAMVPGSLERETSERHELVYNRSWRAKESCAPSGMQQVCKLQEERFEKPQPNRFRWFRYECSSRYVFNPVWWTRAWIRKPSWIWRTLSVRQSNVTIVSKMCK